VLVRLEAFVAVVCKKHIIKLSKVFSTAGQCRTNP
jgi:hypothetical protein